MTYYTGIIIRESIKDERLLKNFDVVNEQASDTSGWHIVNIRIPSPYIGLTLPSIQYELHEEGRWYVQLTNGMESIIVFAKKIFRFPRWDMAAREAAHAYGMRLGIAEKYLRFA